MSDGSTPRFLQGMFEFGGNGYDKPDLIDESLRYTVPAGATAQPVYFRGGNSTKQMITVVLFRDGKPMRYFPIGAKGSTHVALRVVEDLLADTVLELCVAAPPGTKGSVVVDLGLVEF
ncbi:molybdopterin oxidoreductase [Mycobacterium sp. Y57]|uniref:molybdopterin oxidoreductase n=1 Tax=Mycolicibacterium xanthum TaxID=2796469 RepID=UPI001C851268|nr:molybdopterin oxidoreductase [Mycolicibacterium xanthum]MBX7435197.1 molybdopterin oxidoreductase [Mycolicibacterium xanthum]